MGEGDIFSKIFSKNTRLARSGRFIDQSFWLSKKNRECTDDSCHLDCSYFFAYYAKVKTM